MLCGDGQELFKNDKNEVRFGFNYKPEDDDAEAAARKSPGYMDVYTDDGFRVHTSKQQQRRAGNKTDKTPAPQSSGQTARKGVPNGVGRGVAIKSDGSDKTSESGEKGKVPAKRVSVMSRGPESEYQLFTYAARVGTAKDPGINPMINTAASASFAATAPYSTGPGFESADHELTDEQAILDLNELYLFSLWKPGQHPESPDEYVDKIIASSNITATQSNISDGLNWFYQKSVDEAQRIMLKASERRSNKPNHSKKQSTYQAQSLRKKRNSHDGAAGRGRGRGRSTGTERPVARSHGAVSTQRRVGGSERVVTQRVVNPHAPSPSPPSPSPIDWQEVAPTVAPAVASPARTETSDVFSMEALQCTLQNSLHCSLTSAYVQQQPPLQPWSADPVFGYAGGSLIQNLPPLVALPLQNKHQ